MHTCRSVRFASSVVDISQNLLSIQVTPHTPTRWLSQIGDLGTLLLGTLSVNQLQEISLIKYLCSSCLTYAVTLTKNILQQIEFSDQSISYFVRGLLLPHVSVSGLFSSTTSLVRFQEVEISQSFQNSIDWKQQQGPFVSLVLLDQQISSLLKSPNLSIKVALSTTLISQLIDTLKLSTLPLLSLKKLDVFPPLQSPLHSLSLYVALFQQILEESDSLTRDRSFWSILTSISDFFHSMQPLELATMKWTNALVVNNLQILLTYLSKTLRGLGQMKLEIIQQYEAAETKFLFSQIRSLNFSSPIVIPNASTNSGDYTVGIWLKIPVAYYQQLSQFEPCDTNPGTNPSLTTTTTTTILSGENAIPRSAMKTHILSRVPEAGETDMTSLFLDHPTTPCTPGVVLMTLPDGTAKVVVTFTVLAQATQPFKAPKPTRLVKLCSRFLPLDQWIDVVVRYEPITEQQQDLSTFEKGEKARVSLYVDGELHASTEDHFGRYDSRIALIVDLFHRISLHQNIVFGTTPVSLIKPSSSHLLAGGLRWTSKTPTSSPINSTQSSTKITQAITINSSLIQIPCLPLISLQDFIGEASTACHSCALMTSKFISNLIDNLGDLFQDPMQIQKEDLDEILELLRLIPSLEDLAVGLLGHSTPIVDVSS
jgi:hypothetical protein